jgi:hypothetical protein
MGEFYPGNSTSLYDSYPDSQLRIPIDGEQLALPSTEVASGESPDASADLPDGQPE